MPIKKLSAVAVLALAAPAVAQVGTVPINLAVDPFAGGDNEFQFTATINSLFGSDAGSSDTVITGTQRANVTIDAATGVVSALQFTGGRTFVRDFTIMTNSVDLTADDVEGSIRSGTLAVNSGGGFDFGGSTLTFDDGELRAGTLGSRDLSSEPLDLTPRPGTSGSVTSTSLGGRRYEINVSGLLAFDDTTVFDNNFNSVDLRGSGFYSATGEIDFGPVRQPGDANGDGSVTIADFAILRSEFGADCGQFFGCSADFNEDGTVNIADFAILRANFGNSVSPAELAEADAWAASVVPEPTTLGLLAAAGIGLVRRRR